MEIYISALNHRAGTTTPMIVLTDTGRDHLRDHLADYLRAYPDLTDQQILP